jgi:hypothetical protein
MRRNRLVLVSFDDLVALADVRPVVQIASGAFVEHFRRSGHGRGQFFGLFESLVLAFVDDVGLAAIQAAVDEFAAAFQDVLGSVHHLVGVGFSLSNEVGQFLGQGLAFGLAFLRALFVHFHQAANAGFEVIIAAQFEEGQEFLDSLLLGRVGARVHASFGLGGDRAKFRPGFRAANGGWNGAGASDVVLDESADLGTAFSGAHFFWFEVGQLRIGAQFGLDSLLALLQAWVGLVSFVVISEGATENSQQDNDLHSRLIR